MNRTHYLSLGVFLFLLIHLPVRWTDLWRSQAAAALSLAWLPVAGAAPFSHAGRGLDAPALQAQVAALQEWLTEERRLQEFSKEVAALVGESPEHLKSDYKRRAERQKKLLQLRFLAMPAQVIFRDPSSWSSVLWVGLGEADNRAIGRIAIARNSPVLFGNSLVGVVEYVGETQSRIRLITDGGLSVAVRALRGEGQNREIAHHVEQLLERVSSRGDLFSSDEEQGCFIDLLAHFHQRLPLSGEELLAKGEISGCSAPLWRSRGARLKGSGFNYDYPDAEGPARDLRTGHPFGLHSKEGKRLLREGDLLVTSGLDGIFPPGIAVAIAKKIEPLREGGSSYDLEAVPTAGDLQDLLTLLILPPL